jgi:single-strand DNA-binding protein
MNLYVATGNLTKDPEMRYTASGKAITSFRIAINDGRGESRTTLFLSCEAWEKLADVVAEYTRKGSKVLVTGSLLDDSYTDKNSVKHYGVKLNARNVEFLDRREEAAPSAVKDDDLSDLPF